MDAGIRAGAADDFQQRPLWGFTLSGGNPSNDRCIITLLGQKLHALKKEERLR